VKNQDEGGGDDGRVAFTPEERELLVRACRRYRAAIPVYLKSGEEERQLLDRLIEKLSR
jgi:hypothetical protein